MKKLATLILLVLSINISNAQKKLKSIDTLDLNKTTAKEMFKKFKNNIDVKVLILKDGSIVQKGSDFTIGKPSNHKDVNNKNFSYLMIGKYTIMSALGAVYFYDTFSQTEIVVEKIKVFRTKRVIQPAIEFTKKDGTKTGLGKYGSIINLELAILKGEIINPNRPMTRSEAIAKLKEAKDLLDLEMMSEEKYKELKEQLKPLIMIK